MKRIWAFLVFSIFILFVIWEANFNSTNLFLTSIEDIPFQDKIGHFVLYGMLAFLLDFALRNKNWKVFKWSFPASILLVLTFALVEEVSQYWIPVRYFDFLDVVADTFGVVVFVLLARYYQRKFNAVDFSFYKPTKKTQGDRE